ncbi:NaeI family type II restriction endonuclease [Streptomyces avermitilis]|uniref:NaeI family type II restriction endonuclease n=1 Tax=Streptomyces avermitilis TaxID=33903 RepID=UPI0033AAE97B
MTPGSAATGTSDMSGDFEDFGKDSGEDFGGSGDVLPRLLSALHGAVPGLDGTALAEALWLAARMARDQAPPVDAPARTATGTPEAEGPPGGPSAPGPRQPFPVPDDDGTRAPGVTDPAPAASPALPLHERLPGSGTTLRGHPVAAPRAAVLPHALELTRALRPWKRPWPEGRRAQLDMDATVDGYARSGELLPVFTAAPERWFDLALVVDRSPGMQVWRETIAEFAAVLDRLGAFRTLQVADLTFDTDLRPHTPGQLRSTDGRRLVVVVSDCTAQAWRHPEVWHLLRDWAGATPTAVLNPLPAKLWRRGGLNLPTVRFTPAAPGATRSRVPHEPPPLLDVSPDPDEDPWLPIPILSLTPHSLGRWSRALMRGDPDGCTAVLVPPTGRLPGPARPRGVPLPPDTLAKGFLRTAAPRAARLAVLCSPFDRLSLRLLHVIRQELVPEATTADVAEVVTSGVFALEGDGTGPVELVLPAEAQTVFQEQLGAHEVWGIHRAISRHVASRGDGRALLSAAAYDPEGARELRGEREAFAEASRRTLELLGLAETGEKWVSGADGLPPAPPVFVEYNAVAEEMRAQLASGRSRVVLVTARNEAPGAGRTALALQVARLVREHFPDGQFHVDLRGSRRVPLPPDAALHLLLRLLGTPAEGIPREPDDIAAALHSALRGKRVLLVVDDASTPELLRCFAGEPPEGCAVIVTARGLPPGLPGHCSEVWLDSLSADGALSLLEATLRRTIRDDDLLRPLLSGTTWWPLTVRLLGSWLNSAHPPELAYLLYGAGEQPLSLEGFLRLRIDHLPFSSATALHQLAVAETGEFSFPEALALMGPVPDARRLLDTLVDEGLLERRGPDAYGFHGAVHDHLHGRTAYAVERGEAAARLLDFYRSAAATMYENRRPGTALTRRLDAPPLPVRPPEGWIPNALALLDQTGRSALGAWMLFLLQDAGATTPYRTLYEQAAHTFLERTSDFVPGAWGVAALAHAQYEGGRPDDAWHTALSWSEAARWQGPLSGTNALLLGRLTLARGLLDRAVGELRLACLLFHEDADRHGEATASLVLARALLRRDEAARAVLPAERAAGLFEDLGLTAETGNALLCLESALSATGADEELLTAQRRVRAHFRTRHLRDEEAQALARTTYTLHRLGRPAEAEQAARAALALLDGSDHEGAREAARNALNSSLPPRPAPRTVIAIDISGYGSGAVVLDAVAEVLRSGSAADGPERSSADLWDDCCLCFVDHEVPLGPLLTELAERLPAELDAVGEPAPPRLAVHIGPLETDPVDPASDVGIEYTRAMLRSAEFRRLSDNYPDHPTLCVSPEAYEALTADGGSLRQFDPHEVISASDTVVCFVLTPRVDTYAYDSELLALARAFSELDPDGRRLAGALRDCFDAALDTENTGRFDLRQLRGRERALTARELERSLRRAFPFDAGESTDLVWHPSGRRTPVPFELRLSLTGPNWRFSPHTPDALCLVVQADDRASRWSAGLIRVRPDALARTSEPENAGTAELTPSARRSAVLWLHRDAPLPENVLLHLDDATRAAILAPKGAVDRTAEFFRRVQGRPVPVTALRPLLRGQDHKRRVQEAVVVLRPEGVLVVRGNSWGRAVAEALHLRRPAEDELLSVRLAAHRPGHGDRPTVSIGAGTWVVAAPDDPVEPFVEGFPAPSWLS